MKFDHRVFLLFPTLFRTGEGLFDLNCTTGGEGTKRAGLGTGSSIGLLISSGLNQKNFIRVNRSNCSLT